MNQFEYDDDYPTCAETFSALRIYSNEIEPSEITALLDLTPTEWFQKGEPLGTEFTRKKNGWFYSTEKLTQSRDTRRHIDLIIGALGGRKDQIQALLQRGCHIDIFSYWVSNGHGGPMLWPHQMLQLGALGIETGWDIYFNDDDKSGPAHGRRI